MSTYHARFEGHCTFDAKGNVVISEITVKNIQKSQTYLEKVFGRNSDKFLKMPKGIERIYESVR